MQPMKFCFLLIGSLISITTFSQTRSDLTGNWKVIQVHTTEELKKELKANIQKVEKIMLQLRFHFNNDGTCTTDSPAEKGMDFKKCTWTYKEKEKSINIDGIAPSGDKGLLMKLFVTIKNNKWYFTMDETPVILEVQKITAAN